MCSTVPEPPFPMANCLVRPLSADPDSSDGRHLSVLDLTRTRRPTDPKPPEDDTVYDYGVALGNPGVATSTTPTSRGISPPGEHIWPPGVTAGEIGRGLPNALARIFIAGKGFLPLYFFHNGHYIRVKREYTVAPLNHSMLVPQLDIANGHVVHVDCTPHCALHYKTAEDGKFHPVGLLYRG